MTRLLSFLLALCLPLPALAAGSCTISDVTSSQSTLSSRIPDPETVIITVACTADASTGSYPTVTIPLTGASPSGSLLNSYNLTGYILYAVGRTPGSTAPTNNYTTVITDSRGYIVSNALLTTNGSSTLAQMTWMSPTTAPYPVFPVIRGALTLATTVNVVNSAQITYDLIFRTRP